MNRNSHQRNVILEELRRVKTHPTADEVYLMARQRVPKISLGTVYRNLELMAEKGIIRRLDYVDGARRYDGDLTPHQHFLCRDCGRLYDLFLDLHESLEKVRSLAGSFQISEIKVELIGSCPQCQTGSKDSPSSSGCSTGAEF